MLLMRNHQVVAFHLDLDTQFLKGIRDDAEILQ